MTDYEINYHVGDVVYLKPEYHNYAFEHNRPTNTLWVVTGFNSSSRRPADTIVQVMDIDNPNSQWCLYAWRLSRYGKKKKGGFGKWISNSETA